MKKFKGGAEEGMGEGTPYISSDVPATLELSQRFLIQIQFSWCSHPHPPSPPPPLLPYSSFFRHSPPFSPLPFHTTSFPRSVLLPSLGSPLAPVSRSSHLSAAVTPSIARWQHERLPVRR